MTDYEFYLNSWQTYADSLASLTNSTEFRTRRDDYLIALYEELLGQSDNRHVFDPQAQTAYAETPWLGFNLARMRGNRFIGNIHSVSPFPEGRIAGHSIIRTPEWRTGVSAGHVASLPPSYRLTFDWSEPNGYADVEEAVNVFWETRYPDPNNQPIFLTKEELLRRLSIRYPVDGVVLYIQPLSTSPVLLTGEPAAPTTDYYRNLGYFTHFESDNLLVDDDPEHLAVSNYHWILYYSTPFPDKLKDSFIYSGDGYFATRGWILGCHQTDALIVDTEMTDCLTVIPRSQEEPYGVQVDPRFFAAVRPNRFRIDAATIGINFTTDPLLTYTATLEPFYP